MSASSRKRKHTPFSRHYVSSKLYDIPLGDDVAAPTGATSESRSSAQRILRSLGIDPEMYGSGVGRGTMTDHTATARRRTVLRKQPESLTYVTDKQVSARKQNDVVRFNLVLRIEAWIKHRLLAEHDPTKFPSYNVSFHDPYIKMMLQAESMQSRRTKRPTDLPRTSVNTPAARDVCYIATALLRLEAHFRTHAAIYFTDFERCRLQVLRHPLFYDIRGVNVTASARTGHKLDLDLFHRLHRCSPHSCKYNPDKFPGLTWRVPREASSDDPDVDVTSQYICTVTMFATGNINVLRLKSLEQVLYVNRLVEYIDAICGYDDESQSTAGLPSSSSC